MEKSIKINFKGQHEESEGQSEKKRGAQGRFCAKILRGKKETPKRNYRMDETLFASRDALLGTLTIMQFLE